MRKKELLSVFQVIKQIRRKNQVIVSNKHPRDIWIPLPEIGDAQIKPGEIAKILFRKNDLNLLKRR